MHKFIANALVKPRKGIGIILNCLFIITMLEGQIHVSDFTITDNEGITHNLFEDYLEKEKIVVIDLFFVDCPPCNEISPYLKSSYEKWGSGKDHVEFISLSPFDNDQKLESFKNAHFFEHPFSGVDGGGDIALQQFISGNFGDFIGYPTLLIIRPDKFIIFDIFHPLSHMKTVELLDYYIGKTIEEQIQKPGTYIFPNPSRGQPFFQIKVDKEGTYEFQLFSFTGERILKKEMVFDKKGKYDLTDYFNITEPGMYLLQTLENNKTISNNKFIIHR